MVSQITGVSSAPTVIPELESIAKAQYDVFCSTHFDDIMPNVTSRHLALIRGIGADHHFSLLCRGILEKNDIILQIKQDLESRKTKFPTKVCALYDDIMKGVTTVVNTKYKEIFPNLSPNIERSVLVAFESMLSPRIEDSYTRGLIT